MTFIKWLNSSVVPIIAFYHNIYHQCLLLCKCVLREALKKKLRDYLGIFPKHWTRYWPVHARCCVRARTQGGRWSHLLLLDLSWRNNGGLLLEFFWSDHWLRSYWPVHARCSCMYARKGLLCRERMWLDQNGKKIPVHFLQLFCLATLNAWFLLN